MASSTIVSSLPTNRLDDDRMAMGGSIDSGGWDTLPPMLGDDCEDNDLPTQGQPIMRATLPNA